MNIKIIYPLLLHLRKEKEKEDCKEKNHRYTINLSKLNS